MAENGSDGDNSDEDRGDGCNPPGDADDFCVSLHRLIAGVYGVGSHKPLRYCFWDLDFISYEAKRRKFSEDFLLPFTRLPYLDTLTKVEYTTGRTAQVDAVLFGINGEKFGEWQSFLLFQPSSFKSRFEPLEFGQQVTVGNSPDHTLAIVTRILRGSKPARSAADNKTQHCYYVLLSTADGFKYAALQHVHGDGELRQGIADAWSAALPSDGTWKGAAGTPKQLEGFIPSLKAPDSMRRP